MYKAPEVLAALRPIPGHEGYHAGDDGSVWSFRSERPRRLKLHQNNQRGYVYVNLGSRARGCRAARLVLMAFVGQPPDGTEACHTTNPDTTDNRLCNLRWDTRKENVADRERHGAGQRGERNPYRRLTDQAVADIRARVAAAGRPLRWSEYRDIGASHGVSAAAAKRAGERTSWSHI